METNLENKTMMQEKAKVIVQGLLQLLCFLTRSLMIHEIKLKSGTKLSI